MVREQGIDSHVKGYLAENSGSETIAGILLGTELQGKSQPEKTILLDVPYYCLLNHFN